MDFLNKWKDKIAHYVDVRLRLFKLSIIERVSTILSYFIIVFILLFLSLSILIFLGVGLAEYLSSVVNSRSAAYFIVAGIYLFFIILALLLKKTMSRGFQSIFIAMLTQKSEAEDDDDDDDIINKDIKVD